MKKLELLAPAGDMEKLETAFYFGADACYFAGKKYGLRAFSSNFDDDALKRYIEYAHNLGKKAYITVNIQAHNKDFDGLADYLKYLEMIGADAVIVSDAGILSLAKATVKNLEIHISTQANASNKYAAKFWADAGAKRIILARELSLNEIREIRDFLPDNIELEAFVHGAMCISYSGRCLLSNYFTGRDSNHGECVQACRWQYYITEVGRKDKGDEYEIQQDERGTYILNSKDLCMINYLDKMADAGVTSFKIEGRMKSAYYVANVVNAYRRALDALEKNATTENTAYNIPAITSAPNTATAQNQMSENLNIVSSNVYGQKTQLQCARIAELEKCSHRRFTTGFTSPENYIPRGDKIAEESEAKNESATNSQNTLIMDNEAKNENAQSTTLTASGGFAPATSITENTATSPAKTSPASASKITNSAPAATTPRTSCQNENSTPAKQKGESEREYLESSLPVSTYDFIAQVISPTGADDFATVEQRNRFKIGDTLEILSPSDSHNKTFVVTEITALDGTPITDANLVQQHLRLKTPFKLNVRDILRRKK